MFTGLVRYQGKISRIDVSDAGARLHIAIPELKSADIGASICCSGCCLTVVEQQGDQYIFEVSNETLSKTSMRDWKEGDSINIEPSLKMGDELGGHFVFGHVDGVAILDNIQNDGDSIRLTIRPPQNLLKYIAPKGSISLDGISLTVNEVDKESFGVNIIPHTWDFTTLKHKNSGDRLNIEIDMLARYVERMIGQAA